MKKNYYIIFTLSSFLNGLILVISNTSLWYLNCKYSGNGLFYEKGILSQSKFISLSIESVILFLLFSLLFTKVVTFYIFSTLV